MSETVVNIEADRSQILEMNIIKIGDTDEVAMADYGVMKSSHPGLFYRKIYLFFFLIL